MKTSRYVFSCQYFALLFSLLPTTHAFASSQGFFPKDVRLFSRRTQAVFASSTSITGDIIVRDLEESDVQTITKLLDQDSNAFDPEGSLTTDVASSQTIQESYDPNDGGCFLVAALADADGERGDSVGTAGLIIGTPVTYLKSGASISTTTITGAVRRVCVDNDRVESPQQILTLLLEEIEIKARDGGATELIVLAYPAVSEGLMHSVERPSEELLQTLGYNVLPTNLDGADVIQYSKDLTLPAELPKMMDQKRANSEDKNKTPNELPDVATALSLLSTIWLVFLSTSSFLGLDLNQSKDNRGFGTPLSIEELRILQQDELLQRKDIDVGGIERQWNELNAEEQREEAALMKIIQGQDVRMK